MKTKRPILDTTGEVRGWLHAGRGVAVWECHEIGSGRPGIFTPADHVTDERADASHDYCPMIDCKPLVGDAPPVGEQRAPGCRKPHWAYMPGAILRSEADALFYNPGHVVKSWSDTPQGNKAARRALDKMTDATREAPIGIIHTTHTLHRYAMVAAQITPEGTTLDVYGPPLKAETTHRTATDIEWRVGIREWACVEEVA